MTRRSAGAGPPRLPWLCPPWLCGGSRSLRARGASSPWASSPGPRGGPPTAGGWAPAETGGAHQHPAGLPGLQVGTLAPDQRGISLTGASTLLGSSLWVEIVAPGVAGWGNSWYLTEDIPPAEFCSDPQVAAVPGARRGAVPNRDGAH